MCILQNLKEKKSIRVDIVYYIIDLSVITRRALLNCLLRDLIGSDDWGDASITAHECTKPQRFRGLLFPPIGGPPSPSPFRRTLPATCALGTIGLTKKLRFTQATPSTSRCSKCHFCGCDCARDRMDDWSWQFRVAGNRPCFHLPVKWWAGTRNKKNGDEAVCNKDILWHYYPNWSGSIVEQLSVWLRAAKF